jgi:hypothetical protein
VIEEHTTLIGIRGMERKRDAVTSKQIPQLMCAGRASLPNDLHSGLISALLVSPFLEKIR